MEIPTSKPRVKQVQRPWGSFKQFAHNENVTVSLMEVKPGERLSLQSHTRRAELWIVMDDGAIVETSAGTFPAKQGDEFWIKAGERHRLSSKETIVRVLEVAFGDWNQDDITRYEDDYHRN